MNLFSFPLSPSRLGFPQMYLLFKYIPQLSFAVFFFCVYRAWMCLISFFPSAFSSGVCLGLLGSRVWGIAFPDPPGVFLGCDNIHNILIQQPHMMAVHGCPDLPGEFPGFWGDFAVPSVSGTWRSRWDTMCAQPGSCSEPGTWAPQLQPPQHRLCDRRRGTAEDFFLSLDSLLMC